MRQNIALLIIAIVVLAGAAGVLAMTLFSPTNNTTNLTLNNTTQNNSNTTVNTTKQTNTPKNSTTQSNSSSSSSSGSNANSNGGNDGSTPTDSEDGEWVPIDPNDPNSKWKFVPAGGEA